MVNLVLNTLSRARQILGSKYMYIMLQFLQQSESVKCEPCSFSPHVTKNKNAKQEYEKGGVIIGLIE